MRMMRLLFVCFVTSAAFVVVLFFVYCFILDAYKIDNKGKIAKSNQLERRIDGMFVVLESLSKKIPVNDNGAVNEEEILYSLSAISNSMWVINSYLGINNKSLKFNGGELTKEWYVERVNDDLKINFYINSGDSNYIATAMPIIRSGKIISALCMVLEFDVKTGNVDIFSEKNKLFMDNPSNYIDTDKYPAFFVNRLCKYETFIDFGREVMAEQSFLKLQEVIDRLNSMNIQISVTEDEISEVSEELEGRIRQIFNSSQAISSVTHVSKLDANKSIVENDILDILQRFRQTYN